MVVHKLVTFNPRRRHSSQLSCELHSLRGGDTENPGDPRSKLPRNVDEAQVWNPLCIKLPGMAPLLVRA